MPTRVVIAEDEAIIRLDLKETLEEEGYEVVGETGRGDEAVKLVRELEPDLARGKLAGDNLFVAEEVLAKHDEKYMPPEVADSLKQQHSGQRPSSAPLPSTAAAN